MLGCGQVLGNGCIFDKGMHLFSAPSTPDVHFWYSHVKDLVFDPPAQIVHVGNTIELAAIWSLKARGKVPLKGHKERLLELALVSVCANQLLCRP